MTGSSRLESGLLLLGALLVAGLLLLGRGQVGRAPHAGQQAAMSPESSAVVFPPPPRTEAAARRVVAKTAVTEQLLRGEISLFAAAARFAVLNAQPADCPELHWRTLEGASDGEKLCRQVIDWVEHQLQAQEQPHGPTVARLKEELEEHLARHGEVSLEGLD
jgi:hypothetical protein